MDKKKTGVGPVLGIVLRVSNGFKASTKSTAPTSQPGKRGPESALPSRPP
jgi:hypothetical protein